MKRLLALSISIISMFSLMFPVPAAANSAQTRWRGTNSAGAILTDETCPIIVEHEVLSFDIQEFPQNHYSVAGDFMNYTGSVTAEYTFYNPSDYTVNATLVFPFGTYPDYGGIYDYEIEKHIRNIDTEKYDILVNGEAIEKDLRHTIYFPGSQFELEQDLPKLNSSNLNYDFYSPELPVTKYTFLAMDVDVDAYDAATAAIVLSDNAEETKVFMENQCGGASLEDGVRIDTWVDLNEPFSVYVIGKQIELPEWTFYHNGACTDEIDGRMELISTESMTLREFALSEYDAVYGVSEEDWYQAVVYQLDYFEWKDGAFHSSEVDLNVAKRNRLMRWYQYDITLEAGERIVNTVTAPIYPSIDANYEPPVYTYTYLLSPAQTWTGFGDLDIVIDTPYYMTESTESFTWNNPGYELHLEGLPEGELEFTLCTEAEPIQPNHRSYTMIVFGFGAVILVGCVYFKKTKKDNK